LYDDIRDTRPWFWVLILIVLGVAAAGLIVAISAKNSNVDEKKVVNEATAQIKEELSGLNGALKAADELQKEQSKEAARARARIKRAVVEAQTGAEVRLRKLNKRVASLEDEMTGVQGRNTKLRKNVAKLYQEQEALETEIAKVNRRLRGLVSPPDENGGT
jgi:chromosome segregation ATPase